MTSRRWVLLAKVGIGLWVLYVLIQKLDAQAILQALRSPHSPEYLYAAMALIFLNLWFQWYRWHHLLNDSGLKVSGGESWRSLLGGMPLGLITPGRVGEAGRAFFLNQGTRLELVSMVFIDKLYAFGPILIGGGWALIFVVGHKLGYAPFLFVPLLAVGLLISVIVTAVAVHPQWIKSVLVQFSLLFPNRDKFKVVIAAVSRLQPEAAGRLSRGSLGLYAIYMLQFVFLVRAFETLSWHAALIAAGAAMLAKTLLPISFADLGVREGAAVYFFSFWGCSRVAAFNGALLLFFLNVLIPAVLGLFLLPKMGHRVSSQSIKKD